jgi:hypothetical protein
MDFSSRPWGMDTAPAHCNICSISPCHDILYRVVAVAETQSPAPFDELGAKPEVPSASSNPAPGIVPGPPMPQSKALGVQGAERLARVLPYVMALRNLVTLIIY